MGADVWGRDAGVVSPVRKPDLMDSHLSQGFYQSFDPNWWCLFSKTSNCVTFRYIPFKSFTSRFKGSYIFIRHCTFFVERKIACKQVL